MLGCGKRALGEIAAYSSEHKMKDSGKTLVDATSGEGERGAETLVV
jgi:hypothetical protein